MRSMVIVSARLTGGQSTKPVVRFYKGEPPRRVTVGSGDRCAWTVRAAGVEAHHLALCWTGISLHVSCAPGTAPVSVDDQPASESRLRDGAVVRFGGAVFTIEEMELALPNDVFGEPIDPRKAVAVPGTFFGPYRSSYRGLEVDEPVTARARDREWLSFRTVLLAFLIGGAAAALWILPAW